MIKQLIVLGIALSVGGCAGDSWVTEFPPGHPANADAKQAAYMPVASLGGANAMVTPVMPTAHLEVAPKHDAGPDEGSMMPAKAQRLIKQMLDAYIAIGDQLAADKAEAIRPKASEIGQAIAALIKIDVPGDPHIWHQNGGLIETIEKSSAKIAEAKELADARAAYGHLSNAIEQLVGKTGVPAGFETPVQGFVCGMVKNAPREGVWLQLGEEPRNPYFGSRMLRCNSEQWTLPTSSSNASHEHHKRGGDK